MHDFHSVPIPFAHHGVESGNLVVGFLQHGVNILGTVQNQEGWLLFGDAVAHDGSQATFALLQEPDSNCNFAFFVETQKLFDF